MPSQQIVIVGAGIGGLAAAMRLAARGHSVTILEKNSAVGGRANSFETLGYRFDTGPSLLLMTDVYRELFTSCGADFDSLVPLIKMEPNYKVHFGDGTTLEMSSDLAVMVANLEKIQPGVAPDYYRFLADAAQKYRLGRSRFVEKNFQKASDFFTFKNLQLLGRLNALNGMYAHVSRYFKDERLRQAFSMQSMYLGISPFKAPAVYTLLSYTELAEDGLWYPKGGIYALPKAMAQVAQSLGVEIRTDCPIREITIKNGKVIGVRSESGFIPADIVISNADLPYTYTDLLPQRPKKYEEKAWEAQSFTSSAFMLYLGTDCVYAQHRHHNFFLSSDYRRNFEEIFEAKVPPRAPSFYLNCPARTDPSAAPPGGDNLFVLVPIPHLTRQQRWGETQVQQFKEKVYDLLEERCLPNLRDHVVIEKVFTPHDWESEYHLKYGAAFGLSHRIGQVGYFRPANKAKDIENLYFVGASTVPGTGVPLVCIGAQLVTDRILADHA